MKTENEKAIRALAQSIIPLIKKTSLCYDITKNAIIKSVGGNNRYDIILDGITYKNIKGSKLFNGQISVNDVVKITIPCGQYNNMFISNI